MMRLILSLFFLITLFSCQRQPQGTNKPYLLLPNNTSTLFKINEVNDFTNQVKAKPFIYSQYSQTFEKAFNLLQNINPNAPVYLGIQNEDSLTNYIVITKDHPDIISKDSLERKQLPEKNDSSIDSIELDDLTHYYKSRKNNFLIFSNSKSTIREIESAKTETSNFNLLETTSDDVVSSLVFKNKGNTLNKLLFTPWEFNSSNTIALDLKMSDTRFGYNGVLIYSDSISSFIECFKGTIPQSITVPEVVSKDVGHVISLSFNDFSRFETNRLKLQGLDSISNAPELLNYTNEIAKADDYLVMHSLDPDLILETIIGKALDEDYRGINIYTLDDTTLLKGQFTPFFSLPDLSYFAVIKNHVVWANSKEDLKLFISNALNKFTLDQSAAFIQVKEELSDDASILIYRDAKNLSETFGSEMKGYNANVVQFINENDFAHINGIIRKYKKRPKTSEVTESFTTRIEAGLISPPQVVRNHITKGYDIVVQDSKNQLSLISSTGKVLWTKQLEDKVLGPIEQIDMYKNGRLQLAFATAKRLYVLDRNGKDVSPFPLKFRDKITQPLSVFDYDNNRNYRLLVTQGSNLLMYDARGQRVRGFDYNQDKGIVTSRPQHFRIGSKDYIAFKAGKELVILNRRGKTRINVGQTFNFSDNELYLYRNQFTSTTTLGELVQVNTRGKTNKTNLGLPKAHYLTTTSKTLVSMVENQLNIKSRKLSLDYGDYTAPRIFYLNDKIYITTTDKEAKKVYLFDSQAKPIPNFPVYGTSAATLENMDGDRSLELITQDGADTVLVYEIN